VVLNSSPVRPRRGGLRERLLVLVARLMARGLFQSVEVSGRLPAEGGPVILAASHLNGFVDPVLLVSTLRRVPRFLAKAALWRVVAARPFLAFARLIPVRRPQDHAGRAGNEEAFGAAVAALRAGEMLALFPEGTTHDEPRLMPLRTGVARIAVQAAASGVRGLRVLPVGITYEDKTVLRGRALVELGPPVEVDGELERLRRQNTDEREVVRGLTARIEEELREVSPDLPSLDESVALSAAAAVALRDDASRPLERASLAPVATLTRRLADAPQRIGVVDAVGRYLMVLYSLRLRDEYVSPVVRARELLWRIVLIAVVVVALAPIALAGALANLVPALLVMVAGTIPEAPVSKGTVRCLVALLAFPLMWLALAVFDVGGGLIADVATVFTFPLTPVLSEVLGSRSGFGPSLLVFFSAAVSGFVALFVLDRLLALVEIWRSWRVMLNRRGQLDEILELRARVVDAVAAPRPVPRPVPS
jgi:glycerol-3-phosphate O-acyltransferase/dihydroxyacetone phosphate acyltransferase